MSHCLVFMVYLQVTDFLTGTFLQEIDKCLKSCWKGTEKVEKTLYFLAGLVDSNLWFNFTYAYTHYLHHHLSENPRLLVQPMFPNYNYIKRVIVTPSRILYLKPELMHDNRIVRRYCFHYSLRVCFRDEDISTRLSTGFMQFAPDFLEHVIVNTLMRGLVLFGRHYEFLGWSNSQMKDHCVWLYACDPDNLTADHIRRDAGDFSEINIVPKYCARFGQCLTQTEEALKIEVGRERDVVWYQPDIMDKNRVYTFSDGIGKMSPGVAERICQSLRNVKNNPKPLLPSAYQIRYCGCKGMLAIDPTMDGEHIVFRNSQKKFETRKFENSCVLEIAKYSQPSKVMLNRPMIAILEHLREGISHGKDVFHELQETQLMAMSEMLLYEEMALKQLKLKCHVALAYDNLRGNNVSFTNEPFFRDMLLAINRKINSSLAKKARIEIPPEYGRNFLGVLDETGTLEYGQVFIQYSKELEKPRENLQVLKGNVVVTKNPCVHPGDVRMFDAVDVPGLHHMVDVIVFPQKGRRPHPDEMGGSDLDGDEYQAIWLPRLFFERNEVPMDFPKAPKQIHYGPIKVEHMIQWFKQFVEDDQLGLISNAHMAHADRHGLLSVVCLSLARKASFAVDFQKTGYIEKISKDEKVESYPDFMGKNHKTHWSDKILGQLYRKAIRVEQLSAESLRHKPEVSVDQHLVHPNWMHYMAVACKERDAYFQEIADLMAQYGIGNESELISGNLLRMGMVLMERSELYDIERVLRLHVNDLQRRYKARFHEEFNEVELISFEELKQKMLTKASAYYVVTYLENIQNPNVSGLLSFPWVVVHDLLSEMKSKYGSKEDAPLSCVLDEWIAKSNIQHLYKVGVTPGCQNQKVVVLVNILINWATQSWVFHKSPLNSEDVAVLVLNSYENLQLHSCHSVGYMCLQVIQEWASQKFRNKGAKVPLHILTRVYVVPYQYDGNYPSRKIMKLHIAAFDTFHKIAISGQFHSLHLIPDEELHPEEDRFDVGEFHRFQLRLSLTEHHTCFLTRALFKSENIAKQEIEEKIKTLTGLESVELRIEVMKREVVWYVSGYGSVGAREMLRYILVSKQIVQLLREDGSGVSMENRLDELLHL